MFFLSLKCPTIILHYVGGYIECTYDEECYYKLTLKFYNDEDIVFDSLVDTNFSWKNKFNKVIKEIIKVIIDKNI